MTSLLSLPPPLSARIKSTTAPTTSEHFSAGTKYVEPAFETLLRDRLPERPKDDLNMHRLSVLPKPQPRRPHCHRLPNVRPLPSFRLLFLFRAAWTKLGTETHPTRALHLPGGNKERAKEKDRREDSFPGKAGRKTRDWLRVGASDVCAVRCVRLEQHTPGLKTPSGRPEWLIENRYSTTDLGLLSAHARVPLQAMETVGPSTRFLGRHKSRK